MALVEVAGPGRARGGCGHRGGHGAGQRRRRSYSPEEIRSRLRDAPQLARPADGRRTCPLRSVEQRNAAPAGSDGRRGRSRRLAARRRLGRGHRGRRARDPARRGRRRRHLHRHRRRLRRRPQRAARRPFLRERGGDRADRRHQDGPPRRRRSRRTTPSTTSGPGPTGRGPTSASTPSTWCSCTARRPRSTPRDAVFDALDTLVAGEADRGLRRERGDGRRGADRDRPARRGERADHPQRVPAQAARAGAARGGRGRRRHHRPGAAGQRACCPAATTRRTTFGADDHRNYNRHGEAFDVGETFSGVPTSRSGSRRCGGCARWCPTGATMAQFALRWIIDQPGHRGHPRRAQRGAGPRQRRRRRPRAARRRSARRGPRRLRRADPRRTCTTAGSRRWCAGPRSATGWRPDR